MRILCGVVVFVSYLVLSMAAEFKSKHLPSYIKHCDRSDPNKADCSLKNALAAVPHLLKGDKEYKIPNLLPLKVPKLDMKSGDNLQLTLTKVSVFGLDNLKLEKLTIDPVKKHCHVLAKVSWINVDSDYVIKGHILVLPISGNGPANLTFYDNTFDYEMDYNLVKKHGKEYMNIVRSSVDIKTPRAYFHLTNLFNGNKELGDHMNKFMNENSPEVVKDLGIPVMSELVQVLITQVFNAVTRVVPYDELLPLS